MALPKFTLAGFVSISDGELVCVLEFHEAAPCTVSPCVTRATIEVSTPRMRKSWPLVPKARLPVSPGSKKPICTLFQFSWYSGAVPLETMVEELGFPANFLVREVVGMILVRYRELRLAVRPGDVGGGST